MRNTLRRITMASTLAAVSSIAVAAPFHSLDPRSMAMGGTGVAVANTATAPFFNPALLSVTSDEDDFAMELPIVGARAYDPEDFEKSINDFQDANFDTLLNDSIDTVNTYVPPVAPTSADLRYLAGLYRTAADNGDTFNSALQTLDAKPILAEAGAATVLGIPSKKVGAAFSANITATVAGIVHYRDGALLDTLANDARTYADYQECLANAADGIVPPGFCGAAPTLASVDPATGDIVNPETGTAFDAANDIHSEVNVVGMVTQEIALSLSREFALGGQPVAIGITPKLTKTKVYDYVANANSADTDNIDAEDYAREYNDFNIDLGVAKYYHNGWRTGVVVKNLLAREYDAYNTVSGVEVKTGNSVKLNPQARLGISHSSEWHTLALDLDLTENEPVGFEKKSRHLAMGAEFNMADWAQLRAGYRTDLNDSNRNIPSVGLGLSPFGAHLDLAAAQSDKEIAASLQLGFRF